MSWRRSSTASPSRRRCPKRSTRLPTRRASPAYATAFSAESVQLAYQICVQGRADLALAPDEPTGFAMTLLRLLAFEPRGISRTTAALRARAAARVHDPTGSRRAARPAIEPAAARAPVASKPESRACGSPAGDASAEPHTRAASAAGRGPSGDARDRRLAGLRRRAEAVRHRAATCGADRAQSASPATRSLLAVPEASRHLTDKAYADKLKAALDEALGRSVRLRFDVGGAATASARRA